MPKGQGPKQNGYYILDVNYSADENDRVMEIPEKLFNKAYKFVDYFEETISPSNLNSEQLEEFNNIADLIYEHDKSNNYISEDFRPSEIEELFEEEPRRIIEFQIY